MQQFQSFSTQINKHVHLNYLLYLPPEYGQDASRHWPLLMFLHGMGERGDTPDDIERVKIHGISRLLEEGADLPFIIVSPQCPGDSWWTLHNDDLKALLDDLLAHYPVDRSQVYLTGLSMGGYGTWNLSIAYPELFAAVVPVCGGGFPPLVSALKAVPVWAFHGALDDVVPLHESENMVNALQAAGGNVRLTIYPDLKHDSWTVTYSNLELYQWLLSQRKINNT